MIYHRTAISMDSQGRELQERGMQLLNLIAYQGDIH